MRFPWKASSAGMRDCMHAVTDMLSTSDNGMMISAIGRNLLNLGLYKTKAFNEKKAAVDYARRLLDRMMKQNPRVKSRWQHIGTASARVYYMDTNS